MLARRSRKTPMAPRFGGVNRHIWEPRDHLFLRLLDTPFISCFLGAFGYSEDSHFPSVQLNHVESY